LNRGGVLLKQLGTWECPGASSVLVTTFAIDRTRRRKSVTGSRGALNGYQKGKCFYCFRDICIDSNHASPDVDHFFPHVLKHYDFGPLIDGVWNLVLACRECNRGAGGKSARVPSLRLLERLWRRNEYLISSHHPLRDPEERHRALKILACTA